MGMCNLTQFEMCAHNGTHVDAPYHLAMMLDFLTLIINKKMTGLELRQMIFAFPTQTYSVVSGLIPLLKQM